MENHLCSVAVKLEGGTDEDIELLKNQKIVDDALDEIGDKEEDKEENGNTDKSSDENGLILVKYMRF